MSLGRRGRWLKPLGVVLAVVRAFALATVRAPRPALLLLPVIAALGSYVAVEDRAWLGLNRVTGTVLALAAVATLLLWARPRLPRGLLTVGALALAGWAAATAEASLALGWGGWQRTFGAGELRIGIVVFAAVTLGLPWAWRAARAGAGRVQRRRQRPQPGERADPCASGAPPD